MMNVKTSFDEDDAFITQGPNCSKSMGHYDSEKMTSNSVRIVALTVWDCQELKRLF